MASCRCGRRWTGLAQAHCASGCHAHFGSVRGFDRHRATGHCADPGTIATRAGKPVFRADDGPLGITWVLATDRIHPGQVRRLAEEAEDDAA